MKKLLIAVAVIMTVSIWPLAAYAAGPDEAPPPPNGQAMEGPGHPHDQAWQERHDREWKQHEREWRERDREWLNHRTDRHWREEHARMWHDWYQWHKDNDHDSHAHVHVATDDFEIDIDR